MSKGNHLLKIHESKRKNWIGRKFHKLTVISIGELINNRYMVNASCECGNIRYNIVPDQLTRNKTKSCGCDYPICTKGIGLTKDQYYEHSKLRLLIKRKVVNDCWVWTGPTNKNGYGFISWGQKGYKKKRVVPRIAYTIWKGEIPDKMSVMHSCDNPLCFNPDHLLIGTHYENMQDRNRKGRNNPKFGSNTKASKLIEENIIAIRNMRAEGKKLKYIAEIFNVSDANISDICKRKTWKHVK